MASFIGAIEKFNPYIQQIPTDAYTKVGMYKEQQYEAGVQKVQQTIDTIAGLDIGNEGGRNYLRSRVDELTKNLNKYGQIDFSNADNVTQLVGLAKPLYQDENIVTDVINTSIYRKWSKDANAAFKDNKMELGQYARESQDAAAWLSSDAAGATYTGRQAPNTSTKKDIVDRIIKAKRDGFEKSEYVYDAGFDKDKPYYVKTTDKHYSEAEFHNFVSDAILNSSDREMLMNEHWYENQGVDPHTLQKEDILQYQSKIEENNKQIDHYTKLAKTLTGDEKMRMENSVRDLKNYNTQLINGKVKYLQELNLADPKAVDVFHRDLGENRFMNSLSILTDEVKKEEYQKNEQWFDDKKDALEAAKEAAKNATPKTLKGKPKSMTEVVDEVGLMTPVDPDAPKTELSLNVVTRGWQKKNDEINASLANMVDKLEQAGIDTKQFIAGWDLTHVGDKAGAELHVPRFKDNESKQKFYNIVSALDFAATKEAQDGHLDNKSFGDWIKKNIAGYNDTDPNSKFTLEDKTISDALNTLKGTTALIPKLDKLFSDPSIASALSQMDAAIKNKKDMANVYRNAIMSTGALKNSEINTLNKMSDDDLLSNNFFLDRDLEEKRAGKDKSISYATVQEADGTFSIYQDIYKSTGGLGKLVENVAPDLGTKQLGQGDHLDRRKLASGFKSSLDAQNALNSGGQLSLYAGISKKSLDKAEQLVKQTYSYVQQNFVSTVTNLKQDEPSYNAIKDGLAVFLTRSARQAGTQDIQLDGNVDPTKLTGIKDIEINGATISNTEDIFNPNPMYEVTFTASVPDSKGDLKATQVSGRVSLKSFLATNPDYKTSQYAKYFAPALYAEKDAYDRIKAAANPLEGSEGTYAPREDIRPIYNYQSREGGNKFAYDEGAKDNTAGNDIQWEMIPIERDGKQTMISYQVVSMGQDAARGNQKNTDGNRYENGAYYIKMKIPTSSGEPKVIFLKTADKKPIKFSSPSYAHYTLRDLILNNSDIKMEETDPKTNEVNYFTTDQTTLRGIFNAQLSYNGYSQLEAVKIKDAIGKEVEKQQAKQLQLAK